MMNMIHYAMPLSGGGAALNFEIVGGTTQPSSPKENTIWVDTSIAVGEYCFSNSAPGKENYYVFGGSTAISDYKAGWTNGTVSDSQLTLGTDGWMRTTEKIDFTDISVITAYLYIQQPYESEIYLSIGDSYGYKYTGIKHTILSVGNGTAASGIYKEITLDVSDVTGSYYLCLSHRGYGSSYWQYIKCTKSVTIVNEHLQVGDVWVQTATTAPNAFNALKKNTLMTYPIGVFIYDGAAWATATAQIYYDGEWHGFELLLYERGNFYNQDIIPILNNGSTYGTEDINLNYQSGTNVRGIYTQTAPPNGYSTIHMIVRSDLGSGHTSNAQYGQNTLTASLPTIVQNGSGRISYESITVPDTETEITINITGAYGFFIGCINTGRSAKLYKIWLT